MDHAIDAFREALALSAHPADIPLRLAHAATRAWTEHAIRTCPPWCGIDHGTAAWTAPTPVDDRVTHELHVGAVGDVTVLLARDDVAAAAGCPRVEVWGQDGCTGPLDALQAHALADVLRTAGDALAVLR